MQLGQRLQNAIPVIGAVTNAIDKAQTGHWLGKRMVGSGYQLGKRINSSLGNTRSISKIAQKKIYSNIEKR